MLYVVLHVLVHCLENFHVVLVYCITSSYKYIFSYDSYTKQFIV